MNKRILVIGDIQDAQIHVYNLIKDGHDAKIISKYEHVVGLQESEVELHLVYGHQKNQDFAKIFDYARNHNIHTERLG